LKSVIKAAMQGQALFAAFVGIGSLIISGIIQRWLDSYGCIKTTTKERKSMKTNPNRPKTDGNRVSALATTGKIVVGILTNVCSSCLLP
jgi:hypothetical protein